MASGTDRRIGPQRAVTRLLAFIRLSRLHFLPLSALTYLIGIAWLRDEGRAVDSATLLCGLAIQLLVQLSAAYFNDYWDRPTDAINTQRTLLSGGSGELTSGVLPPELALVAAAICQGAAAMGALALRLSSTSYLMLAGAMAIAIFYTAPPLKFAWRGIGELATACVAAILVPQWAVSVQTGHASADLLAVTFPLVPFLMALFVAIATPDTAADRRVGKRTLPVRVGQARIAVLYAMLAGLGYAAALALWIERVPLLVLAAAALSLPISLWSWHGFRALPHTPRRYLLLIVRTGMTPLLLIAALIVALGSGPR